jgi:hypothetical protein
MRTNPGEFANNCGSLEVCQVVAKFLCTRENHFVPPKRAEMTTETRKRQKRFARP